MSTELPQLSDADRAAIERIWWHRDYIPIGDTFRLEAIARHFIGAGLERAAVICDGLSVSMRLDDLSVNGGAYTCAAAIRAAKGQP